MRAARALLVALALAACATGGSGRMPLDRVRTRESAVVETIAQSFRTRLNAGVFSMWAMPGHADRYIVFAEPPPVNEKSYGPQVFVVRNRSGAVEIEHATDRMLDADFLDPAFFESDGRLLMLADYGSEDSWGIVALHLAPGPVQDLGTIDVVRPASIEFLESAVPVAEVFIEDGRYLVTFRGETLQAPVFGRPAKLLAEKNQRAVFTQIDGRFHYVRSE